MSHFRFIKAVLVFSLLTHPLAKLLACSSCSGDKEIEIEGWYTMWANVSGDHSASSATVSFSSKSLHFSSSNEVISERTFKTKVPKNGFFLTAGSDSGIQARTNVIIKVPCGVTKIRVSGKLIEIPKEDDPPLDPIVFVDQNTTPSPGQTMRYEALYVSHEYIDIDKYGSMYVNDGYMEAYGAASDAIHREIKFYYKDDDGSGDGGGDPELGSFHAHWTLGEQGVDVSWKTESAASATNLSAIAFDYSGTIASEITGTGGGHKQLRVSGDGLVDVLSSSGTMTVALYPESGVGSVAGDGCLAVSGTPAKKAIIATTGSTTLGYKKYEDGDLVGDWVLQQTGTTAFSMENTVTGRKNVKTTTVSGEETTVTDEVWDTTPSPDKLLKKTSTVTKDFAWGSEVISEREDPDGENRTTSYVYCEDTGNTNGYGKLLSETEPDGSWVAYLYDSAGRVTTEYRPFKSLPADAASYDDDNGKITWREYNLDGTLSWESSDINGVHNVTLDSYTYTTGSDSNGAALKITTHVASPAGGPETTEVTREFASDGKTQSVDSIEGLRDTYAYEQGTYVSGTFTTSGSGTYIRTTITHGTAAHPEGIDHKTTRDVSIEDEEGRTVAEESLVYTGSNTYSRLNLTVHTYDEDGHLTETSLNERVTYSATYYGNGKLHTETDEQGIETDYTYSGDDIATMTKKGVASLTVSGTTYAAQPDIVTTYTYDLLDRQTSEVVSSGTLSLPGKSTTYTVAGDIASETEGGLTTTYSYDNGGRKTTVTQPTGSTEITENYLDGRTKSITGTGVVNQYFDYDVNEDADDGSDDGTVWTKVRLSSTSSPRWEKTTTDGAESHTLRIAKPVFSGTAENVSTLSYDGAGRLVKETHTGLADTLTSYDELSRVYRTGLDMSLSGTLEPASVDRITETTAEYTSDEPDWYLHTETKEYFTEYSGTSTMVAAQDELVSLTPPYLAFGSRTDVFGNAPAYGSVVSSGTDHLVTSWADSADSNISAVSKIRNGLLQTQNSVRVAKPVVFTYDAFGREIGRTNPMTDTVTVTAYSASTGQIASVTTGTSPQLSTIYEYYPTGSGANTGKLKKLTENGRATFYAWTARGELYRQWGAAYPAEFAYDDYGQMITMKTYRGIAYSGTTWPVSTGTADTTTWAYNEATGLLASKTDAQSHAVSYSWNDAWQLSSGTSARGIVTTYAYNLAGELTSKTYSDSTPSVATTYNRRGLPMTLADGGGGRTRSYTADGQLDTEAFTSGGGPSAWTLHRGYGVDATASKLISLTLGPTTPVYSGSFSYAGNGTLEKASAVLATGQPDITYAYEDNSTSLWYVNNKYNGGGIFGFDFGYDSLDRLFATFSDWFSSDPWYSGAWYTFNAYSQFSTAHLTSSSSRWDYIYNDRGEITDATRYYSEDILSPYEETQWQYDSMGNLLESSTGLFTWKDYLVNTLNQHTEWVNSGSMIPGWGAEYFSYDADGNRTQDASWDYTWDAENRLISMQTTAAAISIGASPKKLVFTYDSQNRRVSKTVLTLSGTAYTTVASYKVFLYDGWNPIAEVTFSGTVPSLAKAFYWGLDLAGWRNGQSREDAGGIGGLWMFQSGTSCYFPVPDAMGNILDFAKADTAEMAGSYQFDPFGNLISSSGAAGGSNPLRFQMQYYDDETGLYYWKNRYYDPKNGRWLSRDPLGEVGGINLYNYVGNDPVNSVDPFGFWKQDPKSRGEARAVWTAEKDDTIEKLAKKVKLDPKEAKGWLRNGCSKEYVKDNADIKIGCRYTVPNVAIVANLLTPSRDAGFSQWIGGLLGEAYSLSGPRARGNKIIQTNSASQLVGLMKKYKQDLWEFSVYGHGNNTGYLGNGGSDAINQFDLISALHEKEPFFKSAQAQLKQCFGAARDGVVRFSNTEAISINWQQDWKGVMLRVEGYNGMNILLIDTNPTHRP